MTIICIHTYESMGGNAYANVLHLIVPDSVDIKEAKQEYDKLYSRGNVSYLGFEQWLIDNKGASCNTDIVIIEQEL